jgi:transposase-like protein
MMRHFRCSDCSHEWDVPFGTGTSGIQMTCPKCASANVHRQNGGGRGRGPAAAGRGRGGAGRGPRRRP